jgi:hypothetical protein
LGNDPNQFSWAVDKSRAPAFETFVFSYLRSRIATKDGRAKVIATPRTGDNPIVVMKSAGKLNSTIQNQSGKASAESISPGATGDRPLSTTQCDASRSKLDTRRKFDEVLSVRRQWMGCEQCDRPDPLKAGEVTGWLKGEHRPPR